MLTDRGNDGNVVLGIGGVQKRVEPASPGGDFWRTVLRKRKRKGLPPFVYLKSQTRPDLTDLLPDQREDNEGLGMRLPGSTVYFHFSKYIVSFPDSNMRAWE